MISLYYFVGLLSISLVWFGLVYKINYLTSIFISGAYGYVASLTVPVDTDLAVYQNIYSQIALGSFQMYNFDILFWLLMRMFSISGLSFGLFYFTIVFTSLLIVLRTAYYFSRSDAHYLTFCSIFFFRRHSFFFNKIL